MKKVFRIQTTAHMNAAPNQDASVHQWLVGLLTQIARDSSSDGVGGEVVDVIVEVIYE